MTPTPDTQPREEAGWKLVPVEPTAGMLDCIHDDPEVARARYALALSASPAAGGVDAVAAWQELCERDDRTSPEEYPDMCLITQAELAEFMSRSALSPAPTSGSAFTYSSTQATSCAVCREHKHTPLRRDEMGGYVCLTCIDKRLDAFPTSGSEAGGERPANPNEAVHLSGCEHTHAPMWICNCPRPVFATPAPSPAGGGVREAARTLYFAFKDYRDVPAGAWKYAAEGHFFSALRLLFDPDADLKQPAALSSTSAGTGVVGLLIDRERLREKIAADPDIESDIYPAPEPALAADGVREATLPVELSDAALRHLQRGEQEGYRTVWPDVVAALSPATAAMGGGVTDAMVNAAWNEAKTRRMTGLPNDFRAVLEVALAAAPGPRKEG